MKLLYKLLGLPQDDPLVELDRLEQMEKLGQIEDLYSGERSDESGEFNPNVSSINNPAGEITFSILHDGNIHINCQWSNPNVAQTYGELLYQINNGKFTGKILSILIQFAQSSPQDAIIVNNIIKHWQNIQTQVENQPLIKPSDVFSIAQLKQNMHDEHENEMFEE